VAATIKIVEKNGAGGTQTDKTSGEIRFKQADNATVDNNHRLVAADGSTCYSVEKWLRLKAETAPSVDITNVRFYTDGANGFGTGIGLYAKAVASYSQPAQPNSVAGYSNAFTFTSAAALSLGAGVQLANPATGEFGDHAVLCMTIGSTAGPGLTAAETLTFSYDET